jgi:steroid delta-isomerase-like uncharacterized protein
MTHQDRDLGRRWFEEVWNQKRREAIAEMLSSDAVIHDGPTDTIGPDGFYPFFDRMHATFSDMHVTVEDTFGDGDKICVRWSVSAKHTGDGLGMPATNRHISTTGMTIIRIANGKLAEGWQNWDMLGLIEQLQGVRTAVTYIGA